MIHFPDKNLIIEGSLANYHLADAFAAAHRRSAMLILVPAPTMTYPDGRNVGRLNIYLDEGHITTVQRNRYFAPNKVAALDLCAPYAPFNPASFSLTLIEREADPENFKPERVDSFTMELAGYSDEIMNFKVEQVVTFYRLAKHATESDRDRTEEENEDQFLTLLNERIEPEQDFTVSELSEATGISSTGCTVLLGKLRRQGFIQTDVATGSSYSGTVGGGGRKFLRQRPPRRVRHSAAG